MKLATTTRGLLTVAICAVIFSTNTLAGDSGKKKEGVAVPAEKSDSSRAEAASGQTQLHGTGLLIVDPRDSQEQIKDRMHRFFSFEGEDVLAPEQRKTEIAREVDALFADDGAAPKELPEITFEFRGNTSVDLFRVSLLSSELARQSDEMCPEGCRFRDLDEDWLHIHLTRPTGGPGDTVLLLNLQKSYGSPEEARLASALPLRHDRLKRAHEDGVRPAGVRIFGLRVTLTDSER